MLASLHIESSCERPLLVNYDTPAVNYYMTMDVYNDYGSCGQFDQLKSLLAGSSKQWYSSCKRTCPHILTIQITQACSASSWHVLSVGITLKGVKHTEIYIDNVEIISVSHGNSRYILYIVILLFP